MSAAAEPDGVDVRINGLHVRCYGHREALPLLFSAGLGGSGSYWAPQIAAFAPKFRVIVYDHRGTGKSDRSPLTRPYTVSDMARDMADVIEGLGLKSAHIVGHAAGAVAGLMLAHLAPASVASLTIVNGWAKANPFFARCMAIRRDIFTASGPKGYLRAQPLFLYPAEWISSRLDVLDDELQTHAATFQSGETLFSRMAALESADLTKMLEAIQTPTLIMASDDDSLVTPSHSDVLSAGLPNALLERLQWGGHAVNITAPERFNDILGNFMATRAVQTK